MFPLMNHHITLSVMVVLSLWILGVCGLIEYTNAKAGYYLPRKDGEADGQWRISRYNTPRDQLRGLIEYEGQLQYLFCAVVLGLSIYHILRLKNRVCLWLAIFSGGAGLISLGFAIYREYFSSLGW